jgi:hypothetical protein
MAAFCFAQFDHVFLYRDFLGGHDETLSRLLGRWLGAAGATI